MRFNTREERDSLIAGFQTKADSLTEKMLKNNEIPQKTKVSFETVTQWDGEVNRATGFPDDVEEVNPNAVKISGAQEDSSDVEKVKRISNPGDIYVMYVRQPQLINASQIIDKLIRGGVMEAGSFAWDSMVLSRESSPEIEEYEIKLGLFARLGNMVAMKAPDFKKK